MRQAFATSKNRWLEWLKGTIWRSQSVGDNRPEPIPAGTLMIGSLLLGMSMQLLVNSKPDIDLIAKSSITAIGQNLSAPRARRKTARR